MRKRRVNKCADIDHFSIGWKELPWVSTYKYLGCVVVIDWTAQIWWSIRWKWGLRH